MAWRKKARRFPGLALTIALVVSACARPPSQDVPAAPAPTRAAVQAGTSASDLLEIVKTLAAPEMAGRATGSLGMERAARYIASEFERAGLRPGGDEGSYF